MSRMEVLLDVLVVGVGVLQLSLIGLCYRTLRQRTNAYDAAYDLGYDIGFDAAARGKDHPSNRQDKAICPVVPLRGDPKTS